MTAGLNIQVGGITLGCTLENERFLGELRENYGAFLTDMEPDYRLAVHACTMDIREDYYEPVVDLSGPCLSVRRRDFTAELDLEKKQGSVEINDNLFAFDSLHRVLYSSLLLRHDGFVLHCCGLVKNGKGYIFLGLSQSGKSTMYRISPGSTLLSDEMVVVRKWAGRYHVYGTPFWGDFPGGTGNFHKPVHGLYFLCKDSSNFTRPVAGKEAVMRIIRNVLFFSRDQGESSRLFFLCSDFVTGILLRELHFLPEPSVWDVIE